LAEDVLSGTEGLNRLGSVEEYWRSDVHSLHRGICESLLERGPGLCGELRGFRGIASDHAVEAASGFRLNGGDYAADGDVADSDDDPVEHGSSFAWGGHSGVSGSLRITGQPKAAVPTWFVQIPAWKIKGRLLGRPFAEKEVKLLLGGDRVLRSFRDAELHDGLRLDLDGFAGLRIAASAGLAVRLHQAAEAGNDENATLLGFRNSCFGEALMERRRGLVWNCSLVGKSANPLCFGQT